MSRYVNSFSHNHLYEPKIPPRRRRHYPSIEQIDAFQSKLADAFVARHMLLAIAVCLRGDPTNPKVLRRRGLTGPDAEQCGRIYC
eukprot:6173659-Pleurochrysis_carterae.AAC.2